MEQQQQSNPLLNSPPELTPTEQDVLDEYERLAENMKKVHQFKFSFFTNYTLNTLFQPPRFPPSPSP